MRKSSTAPIVIMATIIVIIGIAGVVIFSILRDHLISISGTGAVAGTVDISDEIGQTLMVGVSSTTLTAEDRSLIDTVHPGGIILYSRNIATAAQTSQLIADIQSAAQSYSKVPLFIAVDEEGGVVSRLPWIDVKTGEPAITTTSTAYNVAAERGAVLKMVGVNLDLAPVLDEATATDYLYDRTFQEPSTLSGELGAAMIEGYASQGVLATMKHFPGYVGIAVDPEAKLHSVPLPQTQQFAIAAQADPAFVMVANVIYPSLDPEAPFPLSPTDVAWLHKQVPGNYLVITDDLSDPAMRSNFGVGSAAVRSMQAGVDIELVASGEATDTLAAYNALVNAVNDGTISSGTIEREYQKIAAVRAML